jgi:hypothetical protein
VLGSGETGIFVTRATVQVRETQKRSVVSSPTPCSESAPVVLRAMAGFYLALTLVADIPLPMRFTSLNPVCSSESFSWRDA